MADVLCCFRKFRCSLLPSRSLRVVRVARAFVSGHPRQGLAPWQRGRPGPAGLAVAGRRPLYPSEWRALAVFAGLQNLPRSNLPLCSTLIASILTWSSCQWSPLVPSRFVLASSARPRSVSSLRLPFVLILASSARWPSVWSARDGTVCPDSAGPRQ